jgi:hypothetical protein
MLDAENPRAVVGGNHPPTPIDEARPIWQCVAEFLKDHPAIQDEKAAIAANETMAMGSNMIKTLEAAQKAEADPLYSAWQAARAKYKPAIDGMAKIVGEVKGRLESFMQAETARREREAAETRRAAEEAERQAREAERLEMEARDNASVGEIGVDIAGAIEQADAAFEQFALAERQATLAERDAQVRFRSRFATKATALRSKETLRVTDWSKAIGALGLTEKIAEAIVSEARAYRKANGDLPPGVIAEIEKVL